MSKRTPDFARVLTPSSASEDKEPLRASERDAVIELGFLMANADGQVSVDELESFRALVKHLKPEAKVSDVLDQLTDNLDKADAIDERVRAIVPLLARPAARDLVEVLGLASRVDDLELEVNEALNG